MAFTRSSSNEYSIAYSANLSYGRLFVEDCSSFEYTRVTQTLIKPKQDIQALKLVQGPLISRSRLHIVPFVTPSSKNEEYEVIDVIAIFLLVTNITWEDYLSEMVDQTIPHTYCDWFCCLSRQNQ